MIKAIIFDVGGVLIRTMDRSGRDALEKRLGLARGESERIVFNSEMGTRAQLGTVTTAELWAWVQQHLHLNEDELAAFQRDFWAGDKLDTALVDTIRQLKIDYQTAIISNALDNLNHVVTELFPMADAFDLIVGSAYEKVMKPDPVIYRRTLSRLGCRPQEAIFIDDSARNIASARAVGLYAIHFTADTNLAAELAKLGVIT